MVLDGRIRLAPMYDVIATVVYPQVSTTRAMFVNGSLTSRMPIRPFVR